MSDQAAGSDPREVGRIIALRLLDAKPRTCGELRGRLVDRGIPEDVAEEIVARYVEVGLLDDRAYAQLWVESRMRSRGLGPTALRRELRQRKVPDEIIGEVLAEIDVDDTHDAAVSQVRSRVARCELPLSQRDEQRLIAYLMRRGHGLDAARAAIGQAVQDVGSVSSL